MELKVEPSIKGSDRERSGYIPPRHLHDPGCKCIAEVFPTPRKKSSSTVTSDAPAR